MRDRYLAAPTRFPEHARFYAHLDRYATLVRRFGAEQGARPPEIRIYRVAPESAAVLTRDLGELMPTQAPAESLVAEDFLPFVEGAARAAYVRGHWARAERYFRLLLEAGARGGLDPERQAALSRLLEQLRARATEPVRASRR